MSEQEQEPKPEEEEEKEEPEEQKEEKKQQQELKPEVVTPQMDERFKKFWDSLVNQSNQVSQGNFEKMIVTDEYQYNGTVYKAKMLTYKEKHELDLLQDKGRVLSEKENWDEWYENQKARACLLIEDMTPERFEKENSYILETIISAWGLKPQGFRDLFSGTGSVL